MSLLDQLLAWSSAPGARSWTATLVLVAVALLLRVVVLRALGRSRLPIDVRQRWLAQLRAALLLVVGVGVAVIWAEALHGVALSIAAVAVAVVIATKELLLCLSGAFLRTASRSFAVGDRIEIAGLRGNVVDAGALTTTLLEVAPGSARQTGRTVIVPNSLFLTERAVNETYARAFGLMLVRIPLAADADWRQAERRLLEIAREECAPHLELARRHSTEEGWERGLGPDSVEPSVTLSLSEPGRIDLLLRFPAPTRSSARVEQAILRRFLSPDAAPRVSAAESGAAGSGP